MGKAKPNRRTVPINVQISPAVAAAARSFAIERGQKLRDVVEQALQRHIASPPPVLELPPLPPVGFTETPKPKRQK